MRVAIANQKGGVGKTTTAVNLASGLAERGYRCLLVDLDPQANATTGLGVDHRDLQLSTYDVVIDGRSATDAIIETGQERLHLLPSSIDLAGAELELVPAMARESKLRHGLDGVTDRYDIALIDCPPSLGLLTVNALTAADLLLIPIQCEYYALEGLTQLLRNIELVRSGLNARLEIGAIVLTMYDARTRLSEQVAAEIRQYFPDRVFSTVIPRSVRLSEAPSYGQPAVTYDPSSRGSMAYGWLAEEFEARVLEPKGVRPTGRPAPEREPVPEEGMEPAPQEDEAPAKAEASSWDPAPPPPRVRDDPTESVHADPYGHRAWPQPSAPEPDDEVGTHGGDRGSSGTPSPLEPDGPGGEGPPEDETEGPTPPVAPGEGRAAGPRGAPEGRRPEDPEAEAASDDADERSGEAERASDDTEGGHDVDDPWSYRGEREGW